MPRPTSPIYQMAYAWMVARGSKRHDKLIRKEKIELFSSISGTVLEIGAGSGINLQYLPSSISYIGLEPNRAMDTYLQGELDTKIFPASWIIHASAERIPLEDASVDAVISTLTLCTIPDPKQALEEIRRILKFGGSFFFIEHVADTQGSFVRHLQH